MSIYGVDTRNMQINHITLTSLIKCKCTPLIMLFEIYVLNCCWWCCSTTLGNIFAVDVSTTKPTNIPTRLHLHSHQSLCICDAIFDFFFSPGIFAALVCLHGIFGLLLSCHFYELHGTSDSTSWLCWW